MVNQRRLCRPLIRYPVRLHEDKTCDGKQRYASVFLEILKLPLKSHHVIILSITHLHGSFWVYQLMLPYWQNAMFPMSYNMKSSVKVYFLRCCKRTAITSHDICRKTMQGGARRVLSYENVTIITRSFVTLQGILSSAPSCDITEHATGINSTLSRIIFVIKIYLWFRFKLVSFAWPDGVDNFTSKSHSPGDRSQMFDVQAAACMSRRRALIPLIAYLFIRRP